MPAPAYTVIHYNGTIPLFVEPALDRLYGSLYSTLAHLRLHDPLTGVCTYGAWDKDKLTALFLYEKHRHAVRVLNEGMQLSSDDINHFAEHLFGQEQAIDRIEFHAVKLDGLDLDYAAMRFGCTEDIVIDLPDSEDAYLSQLGKSTRKTLRHNLARAQRLLPGFRHEVRDGKSTPEQTIRALMHFNHARMAGKQQSSALVGKASDQLMALMRTRGQVGLVTVDGTLCGGTLACRIGDDLFSLVNAHDPAYDGFSMGSLSRYLMITASIHAGAKRFHLLGGQLRIKQAMHGEKQRLDHLVLYRTRLDQLLHAGGITQLAGRSALYHTRAWVEEQSGRQQRLPARLALRLVDITRHAKRQLVDGLAHLRAHPRS